MQPLKILLVIRNHLYPVTDGYNLRLYELFRRISHFHQVDCLTFLDDEGLDVLPPDKNFFNSVYRIKKKEIGKNHSGHYWYSPDAKKKCEDIVMRANPNLIHIAPDSISRNFIDVHRPTIMDICDNTHLSLKREICLDKRVIPSLRKIKWLFDVWRFERQYLSKFKYFIVVAPDDAVALRKNVHDAHVSIIPNGVDYDYYKTSLEEGSKPSVVFTGVMDFNPNVNGILWFCKHVLPLIRKTYPDIKFYVVGRKPVKEIQNLQTNNPFIKVTGEVEDIRPYVNKSWVFVCPLRSGSGIKNKLLEAWAMAKPVVATSISCGSLPIVHKENIFVADTPEQFAEHTISLLKDTSLRRRIGEQARNTVVEGFSWDAQVEKYNALYKEVLGKVTYSKG